MINESINDIVNREGYGISPQRIVEASLARVLRWMAGTPTPKLEKGVETDAGFPADEHQRFKAGGHFAILTSWRKFDSKLPTVAAGDQKLKQPGEGDLKANQRNFRDLVDQIVGLGLGAIRLTGSWLEAGGAGDKPYERSIFIPGKDRHGQTGGDSVLSRSLVKNLGLKYNQDAVIYCGPETKGIVELWQVDRDYAEQNNGKLRYFPTPSMTWKNVGLRSAAEIEKNLNRAKDIIARGEEKTEDDPSYFNVGASQVGTHADAKGNPKLGPGAGLRFEQVYEAVGQESCSLGVRWLNDEQIPVVKHRIQTLLENDTLAEPVHRQWMSGNRECFEY